MPATSSILGRRAPRTKLGEPPLEDCSSALRGLYLRRGGEGRDRGKAVVHVQATSGGRSRRCLVNPGGESYLRRRGSPGPDVWELVAVAMTVAFRRDTVAFGRNV